MDWYRTWCQWRLCSLSFLKKNICRSEEKNLVLKGDESWCERASSTASEMSSLWLPWANPSWTAVQQSAIVNWNIFKFYPVKNIRDNCFREREKRCSSYRLQPLQSKKEKERKHKTSKIMVQKSKVAELQNPGRRLLTH